MLGAQHLALLDKRLETNPYNPGYGANINTITPPLITVDPSLNNMGGFPFKTKDFVQVDPSRNISFEQSVDPMPYFTNSTNPNVGGNDGGMLNFSIGYSVKKPVLGSPGEIINLPVFIDKKDKNPVSKDKSVSLWDPVKINYALAKDSENFVETKDFIDKFGFIGVTTRETSGISPLDAYQTSGTVRKCTSVSVMAGGKCSTHNIWGRVSSGYTVGFVLKGIQCPNSFQITDNWSNINNSALNAKFGPKIVLQLMPWSSSGTKPSKKDLMYKNNLGEPAVGIFIKVGIVADPIDNYMYRSMNDLLQPITHRSIYVSKNMISIYVLP